MTRFLLLILVLLAAVSLAVAAKRAAQQPPVIPFIVTMPEVEAMTEIVLQYDPAAKTGADWAKAGALQWYSSGPEVTLLRSAQFLREGIRKMTGQALPVKSTNDLSRGIVLTTLATAPKAVRNDPNVQWALRDTGKNSDTADEAYYLRSETNRVLVIGNTPEGVLNGVVALLESVDYEILGMGPNWIYAPDYAKKPLVFALRQTGRPGYDYRGLEAASGQSCGVGTLMAVNDPADEPVTDSYRRWQIGTRQSTSPMPAVPALQEPHNTEAPKTDGPSGDDRFSSLSTDAGPGASDIPPNWSNSAQRVRDAMAGSYQAGSKAMCIETDFNFARDGLGYYLIAKMLWNPTMTAQELDQMRDRWFQKAYGSAWQEMKVYYDFMNPEHYPVNGPNTWAKAIRLVQAAQRKLSTVKEPAAQRRLDDLKQFWYYHYLEASGQAAKDSRAYREFAWKGQMSYMVAEHIVMRKTFGVTDPKEAAPEFSTGPAHYTHDETQVWWAKVLAFWPLQEAASSGDVTQLTR